MIKNKLLLLIFCIISSSVFSQYNDDIFVFTRNGLKGYVNSNFEIIVKPEYQNLGGYKEKFFGEYSIFYTGDYYGILNKKGGIILDKIFSKLDYTKIPSFYRFQENNKVGLIDLYGNIILEAEYDFGTEVINHGKNIEVHQDGLWALFSNKGEQLTPFKYERLIGGISSNLTAFKSNAKWGYLDEKGEEVIAAQFDWAHRFDENLGRVKINNKHVLINKKGEVITPNTIEDINWYKQSYEPYNFPFERKTKVYHFKKEGKIGLINTKGEIIVKAIYDEIGDFNEALAYVKKDGLYGYIDEKGTLVIPLKYGNAGWFSEGLAPVVYNNKWGYINRENEVIIPFQYVGYVGPFSDGLAVYRKRGSEASKKQYSTDKVGFINNTGEIQIPLVYKSAKSFKNGAGLVKKDNMEYLINKEGELFNLNKADIEIIEVNR